MIRNITLTKGSMLAKIEKINRGIDPHNLDAGMIATMANRAPQVEAHAKLHAPWTDRTTNARNGLHALHVPEGLGIHEIVLAHSVPYGIWLEIANNGRYKIIMPTLRTQGRELMRDFRTLLRRIT